LSLIHGIKAKCKRGSAGHGTVVTGSGVVVTWLKSPPQNSRRS
jgi:hypothetical protein